MVKYIHLSFYTPTNEDKIREEVFKTLNKISIERSNIIFSYQFMNDIIKADCVIVYLTREDKIDFNKRKMLKEWYSENCKTVKEQKNLIFYDSDQTTKTDRSLETILKQYIAFKIHDERTVISVKNESYSFQFSNYSNLDLLEKLLFQVKMRKVMITYEEEGLKNIFLSSALKTINYVTNNNEEYIIHVVDDIIDDEDSVVICIEKTDGFYKMDELTIIDRDCIIIHYTENDSSVDLKEEFLKILEEYVFRTNAIDTKIIKNGISADIHIIEKE